MSPNLLVRKLGVSENMRENNKYEDTGNHQILHLIINFLKFEQCMGDFN